MKYLGKVVVTALLASGLMCAAQTSSGASDQNADTSATASKSKQMKGNADELFAKKAAEGGMAEVELGQLATQNAESADVKQFGQRMVDDHTKANDQLKQIAEKNNITLPTELNAKDKAEKDRLSKLNGAAFDRAYMHHMVMDHTKDVNEFKKEASSGKNADIKSFAEQTTPTLEDHLKMAKQINSSTKQGAGPSSKNNSSKKSAGKSSGTR